MNKTWDTTNDRLLAVEGPNGRQTVSQYDYLGRAVNRWGPAPADHFTTAPDGSVVPDTGFGDTNLISSTSSFDADTDGKLAGLSVSTYTASTPGGVPAGSLGSCAAGQCSDPNSSPLLWDTLPNDAKLSNGTWSLNAVTSRQAPAGGDVLQYRVTATQRVVVAGLGQRGVQHHLHVVDVFVGGRPNGGVVALDRRGATHPTTQRCGHVAGAVRPRRHRCVGHRPGVDHDRRVPRQRHQLDGADGA